MKALLFALLAVAACAAEVKDLSNHFLLKHYVGKWEASGTLKNQQGNDVEISEEWTGRVEGPGTFVLAGNRTFNGETQSFTWTLTHNPATDSFEAMLLGQDGNQLRFEAQFSESEMTLELKAVTGNGNGSITVLDRLKGESKDEIESEVTFIGDGGETTLQGKILHKRLKTA
ncbi:MAG: hypothetical protein JNJ83_24735 [Verrucomicrobiaceae bacterium]|nr:hypothetical protein [Verrucomicrobiaceae bacterium]